MKATLSRTIMLGATLSFALLAVGCASSRTYITEEKKFIPLQHLKNTADELTLKKGDAVAMACTKCKTVLYADVNKPRTRFFTPLEHRHYCPGYKSTITVTWTGLRSKQEVKHTCEGCGDDSIFCCATKSEASATEGMEKKK